MKHWDSSGSARQGSDGTWYAPDEDQDIEGDGGWWWYRLNAQMEHSPTDGLSPAEASALGLGDPQAGMERSTRRANGQAGNPHA